MDRWKRSVVHLECASDSEHFYDRIKRIDALQEQLRQGAITPEQFAGQLSSGSRDIRSQGTAIFLEDEGARYLLTARHVLWDKDAAQREVREAQTRTHSMQGPAGQLILQSAVERADERIFNIVFRVPSGPCLKLVDGLLS